MNAMDFSGGRGQRRGARLFVLLLLALVLPLAGSQFGHSHRAGTPGIYNAECPLAALAAFNSGGSLLPAPASAWVVLVAGALSLGADHRFSSSAVRLTDSRAPPLV